MYTDFWLYLVSKLLGNSLFKLCPHLLLHVGHVANTCIIARRGGHGGLRYCGIGLFSCVILIILILRYHLALRYAVFHHFA